MIQRSNLSYSESFLDLIKVNPSKLDVPSENDSGQSIFKRMKNRCARNKAKRNRERILLKSFEELYDIFSEKIEKRAHDEEQELIKKRTSQAFATQILDEVDDVLNVITTRHIFLCLILVGLVFVKCGVESYYEMPIHYTLRYVVLFYMSFCLLDVFNYKRIKSKLEGVVDLAFSSEIKYVNKGLDCLKEIKNFPHYYGRIELDYICLSFVCVDFLMNFNHISAF